MPVVSHRPLVPTVDAWSSLGTIRRHPPGSRVVHQGAPVRTVHRVARGTGLVVVHLDQGDELTLAVLRAGDWVGAEEALVGLPCAAATVVARDDLVTQDFPLKDFLERLERHPEAAGELTRALAHRLTGAQRRRVDEASLCVPRRLAVLLLDLADQTTAGRDIADVGYSQAELAGLLGVSRDTMTRGLRQLRLLGLVQTQRRRIRVLSTTGLRRYALRGLR